MVFTLKSVLVFLNVWFHIRYWCWLSCQTAISICRVGATLATHITVTQTPRGFMTCLPCSATIHTPRALPASTTTASDNEHHSYTDSHCGCSKRQLLQLLKRALSLLQLWQSVLSPLRLHKAHCSYFSSSKKH